jgi:hypothetical protein
MDTLTSIKRNSRARLGFPATVATLVLAALLSACGGGGAGGGSDAAASIPAGLAAAPAAGLASSPAGAASAAAPAGAPADGAAAAASPVLAAEPPLSAAPACTAATCGFTPADALAVVPGYLAPLDPPDGQGYLVPSTDAIATTGEPPYPDLRGLPTRVLPFQGAAFGDMSAFSVASVR